MAEGNIEQQVFKICVKGYAPETTEESLKELFSSFGEILDFHACRGWSKTKKEASPYCYVGYSTETAFRAALSIHGTTAHCAQHNNDNNNNNDKSDMNDGSENTQRPCTLDVQPKDTTKDNAKLQRRKQLDAEAAAAAREKEEVEKREVELSGVLGCEPWRRTGESCTCKGERKLNAVLQKLTLDNGLRHLPPLWQREELVFQYDTAAYQWRRLMFDLFALGIKLDTATPAYAAQCAKNQQPGADGDSSLFRPGLLATSEQVKDADIEGETGEEVLSGMHKVYDPSLRRSRSNREHFHVAYARILRADSEDTEEILALRKRFYAVLRKYIREVCSQFMGVGPDDLYYQRSPTLRVSFPVGAAEDGGRAMGRPHKDYDYYHQPAEVNFWLPLTEVYGTNTLHAESAPGRKDFHPFELGYGRCVRFWGNQAWHYCVPNSEPTTRVSLDFRVVAKDRFNPNFKHSDQGGGDSWGFKVGEFYMDSADAEV